MPAPEIAHWLLAPYHLAMLTEGSAIAPALVRQRGYQSLSQPEDLIDRGFSKAQAKAAPALGIPLWDVHGQRHGWQIRPDAPRQMKDGKVFRYEMPKGERLILDVHPSVQPLIGDPDMPLWITEGIKKGDALASQGICTIALIGGVWGFRGTNEHGGKVILPDWEHVALNNRLVYVAFDSDLATKPNVQAALKALWRLLRDRQARPTRLEWTAPFLEKKWGIDDFFAAGHTRADLEAMLPPMRPLPPTPPHASRNGHAAGTPPTPVIRITPDVAGVVNTAITTIEQLPQAPLVYQRARRLCVIAQTAPPPRWLRREKDTPIIQEASPAWLWERMAEAARWEKYDARAEDWRETFPPHWAVEVLQGRSHWPFPVLEGVICSPTLRPDGSLLATPGYDPDTGLYLDLNGTSFPPLPDRPTFDEARSALGAIHEVFQDFPVAIRDEHTPRTTNPSLSAIYAAVLTVVGRAAIQGNIPCFGVTATAAGSGKGKLVDTIALIATGRQAPKMGQFLDENEEGKRLLALALEGVSLCCIDNVAHPLGNQYLDMALTARSITGRILGQSATGEAPWNAVLFATGNNLAYRGDMARRVIPIALDPKMEKPEERTGFQHPNLEAWVTQERPRLVMAALTILRAYFVAGCPAQAIKPYGSFEAWSDVVRSALVWLGEADPCEGRQDLAAQTDEGYERLATLLAAWEACYACHEKTGTSTAKTLNQVKQEIALYAANKDQVPNTWDTLRDALVPFDRRSDGRSLNTHLIGNALRTIEGRVISTKRLKRCGEIHKTAFWRIEAV